MEEFYQKDPNVLIYLGFLFILIFNVQISFVSFSKMVEHHPRLRF